MEVCFLLEGGVMEKVRVSGGAGIPMSVRQARSHSLVAGLS